MTTYPQARRLYSYHCPRGHSADLFRAEAERNAPAACPTCGGPLARRLTAPRVQNLSASVDSLCSVGHDERRARVHKHTWLAEERRARLEIGALED